MTVGGNWRKPTEPRKNMQTPTLHCDTWWNILWIKHVVYHKLYLFFPVLFSITICILTSITYCLLNVSVLINYMLLKLFTVFLQTFKKTESVIMVKRNDEFRMLCLFFIPNLSFQNASNYWLNINIRYFLRLFYFVDHLQD